MPSLFVSITISSHLNAILKFCTRKLVALAPTRPHQKACEGGSLGTFLVIIYTIIYVFPRWESRNETIVPLLAPGLIPKNISNSYFYPTDHILFRICQISSIKNKSHSQSNLKYIWSNTIVHFNCLVQP